MEFTTVEIKILQAAEVVVANESLKALDELQLTLVGGGVGEVIFG
jgi:hypothetical protein